MASGKDRRSYGTDSKKKTAGKTRSSKRSQPISTAGKKTTSRTGSKNHNPARTVRKSPWKSFLKSLLIFFALCLAALAGTLTIAYARTTIPSPESVALAQKTRVYYSDGKTLIGSYFDQNRQIISCSALPDYVGNAVVASENRTFWTDSGIDFKGIARALINNVTTGSRQGGSTITQQYAERYYLGETTTYWGKLKEALLALKISQTQEKGQVLCNYLNTIYFGRGAYGIQAAAQAYFHKDAANLTVSQAALLAGIIPAPSAWDPAVSLTIAARRFQRVIAIMKEDGTLSSRQAQSASLPTTAAPQPTNEYQGSKGYILTMVRSELLATKKFSPDSLATGGYSIVTSLDTHKQKLMEKTVQENNSRAGLPQSVETGGISVNSHTGGIISLYAGKNYASHQLNNLTQARFEPGSTMKAFTLLAAIQQGCSLNTTFNGDSPRSFPGLTTPVKNYKNVSYGRISLYQAIAQSVNTVFVDLNARVTPEKTANLAAQAGISSPLQTHSLYNTLGIDGITLKELVQAYATFSTGGVRVPLHLVSTVTSSQGKTIYQTEPQGSRIFNSSHIALLNKALTKVILNGTGSEATIAGRSLAGKSGTANDNTAAVFVGYTPSIVTAYAIWNSSAHGSAAQLPTFSQYQNGHGYPTHLFASYMRTALAGSPHESFPQATDTGRTGGPYGTWGKKED